MIMYRLAVVIMSLVFFVIPKSKNGEIEKTKRSIPTKAERQKHDKAR